MNRKTEIKGDEKEEEEKGSLKGKEVNKKEENWRGKRK